MNNQTYLFRNEKGFSLVGTVIASAIGLIVIGVMAKVMVSQGANVSYLEDRLSKVNLKGTIQNVLVPLACKNTFAGQSVPSTPRPINILRDVNNNVVFQSPLPSGDYPEFEKLQIQKMELHNVSLPNAADSSGKMKFVVFPIRNRGLRGSSISGSQLEPISVELDVATNGSALINDCSQSGGSLSLNPGELPCILNVLEKTAIVPPPSRGLAFHLSSNMKSSYTGNMESG